MTEPSLVVSIEDLAARIPDGASLALPKDSAGAPMAAVRALIGRGVKDLHLINVPTNGLATDWLVGAGAERQQAEGRKGREDRRRRGRPSGRHGRL